jgi:membrane-bound serine protease (ClpP class)
LRSCCFSGIICAYLEFKIPGASLPGIVAALCFALSSWPLSGWPGGLGSRRPFVLGVVLVLIEILFFAHSTIVFGVAGVFLILGSLLWAMVDRYPGETFFPTGQMIAIPMRNLFLAILAAMIAIIVLARYLPRTSLYRRFALMTTNPPGPSLAEAPREFATALALVPGMEGAALTTLRPSGKARFADHVVDVVTEGEFVAAETPVTVIQTDGMRVVVKRLG